MGRNERGCSLRCQPAIKWASGLADLQAPSGIGMGTQQGGWGWREGTQWVTRKGGCHLDRLLLLSQYATPFTGYLPGGAAVKHQC